jgi:hypothetical protein
MRFRSLIRGAAAALLGAGLGAAGCKNDVNVTDPNTGNSATFGLNAAEANSTVIAAYNGLLRLGTFQRWQAFTYDLRSDIGTSRSPRADFQRIAFFEYPAGYDAEINVNTWDDAFTLVSRANQVTAIVPNAQMDAALKAQYVGEGKFLRALGYFHLLTCSAATSRSSPPAGDHRPAGELGQSAIYAQIESDLTDAVAALPGADDAPVGRPRHQGRRAGPARQGAAQQRKWAPRPRHPRADRERPDGRVPARAELRPAVHPGRQPERRDAVRGADGQPADVRAGRGRVRLNIIRMIGPCGIGFCDGEPTRWYFDQFRQERTTAGALDPRLDATIFYYKGDTTTLFNRTWRDRYGSDTTRIFWKKYSEYYLPNATEQSWEAQINYKVVRLADVYLMYAEAVNEQGQTAAAYEWVNRVRRRASLADLRAGLTQAQMREEILRQRLLEFGLESQRWFDMRRQNLFADLAGLRTRDPDFASFTAGRLAGAPHPAARAEPESEPQAEPGLLARVWRTDSARVARVRR